MNMNKQFGSAYEYSWAVGGREAEKLLYNILLVMQTGLSEQKKSPLDMQFICLKKTSKDPLAPEPMILFQPRFIWPTSDLDSNGNKSCYIS